MALWTAGHAACSGVRSMEQTAQGVDRTDAVPSPSRTVTPVTAPSPQDDLRLALELADIGADLASEFGSQPNTESAELRRQISRLRERVQCPRIGRTPTMHFTRRP